jgi:hypothetical protein
MKVLPVPGAWRVNSLAKSSSCDPSLLAELRRLQDENEFLKVAMKNLERTSDTVSDNNDYLRGRCLGQEVQISELKSQLAAKPPKTQTKLQSAIESVTNVIISGIGAWVIVYCAMEYVPSSSAGKSLISVTSCALWSFARSYTIRRLFNR